MTHFGGPTVRTRPLGVAAPSLVVTARPRSPRRQHSGANEAVANVGLTSTQSATPNAAHLSIVAPDANYQASGGSSAWAEHPIPARRHEYPRCAIRRRRPSTTSSDSGDNVAAPECCRPCPVRLAGSSCTTSLRQLSSPLIARAVRRPRVSIDRPPDSSTITIPKDWQINGDWPKGASPYREKATCRRDHCRSDAASSAGLPESPLNGHVASGSTTPTGWAAACFASVPSHPQQRRACGRLCRDRNARVPDC